VSRPSETVDPRPAAPPRHPLPAGACDSHAHVFGPFDRFPPSGPTAYPPPLAPFSAYRQMQETVGTTRGLLVQPTLYGTDPTALLDALRQGRGWVRGIATATRAVGDRTLDEMHDAGVRGLRFIEMPDPRGGGRYSGGVGTDELIALAPRLRERGWHAQIWARADDHARLLPSLIPLGLPIVLDHMGSPTTGHGAGAAAFRQIVSHLADGDIWVKLPLCRNSRVFPDYSDLRPFHEALVTANPRHLVWGSDWPHVRMGDLAPDVGHLLDLFFTWVGSAATRQQILVDNAHALFGFDSVRPARPGGVRPASEMP
jgi:2-pyrone-4,6-dicarboxylate lactonase